MKRRHAAWAVALAGLSARVLAAVPPAARLTPPPTLESIPPRPAAADSEEARLVATLPAYRPEAAVGGVIRLWGHGNAKLPWMRHLVALWEQGFQQFHPGIRFDYQMHGTSSGVPALFTGIGDVAILGEEILPEAVLAFERVRHYPPLGIEIATGSLDVRNFDYAQQFFVHRDNPLTRISLAELDALFGTERRRGWPEDIRRWGQLGLKGAWADRPISLYGWAMDDSFGAFMQEYLLGGSHRWNCALHEYVHRQLPDGSIYDHGAQILDALAQDRFGLAVSNIRYAVPEVKPLALARRPGEAYVHASKASLIDQRYPLARTIPAVIDRPPGMPIEPKVKAFLSYLLSREGQEAVNRDGRYLPLSPELLAEQRRKIV